MNDMNAGEKKHYIIWHMLVVDVDNKMGRQTSQQKSSTCVSVKKIMEMLYL